jgi:hypothetical protein
MGLIIIFNMVMIIIETDHGAENEDTLPWAEVVGWINLSIFVTELTLRLFALRMQFWQDRWNTFDFLIVVSDALCSIIGLILGDIFPVSTLRIFRLCKLARVSKVFRVFPELRIMMAGLLGSMRAIFWGTVLLAFVLLVWAIVAVQFIHPLNKKLSESGGLSDCERCPRAYSSVMQATLTFSQQIVAGDSWGTATIPLIEAYPGTAIYFLAVFLSVGFAVMNLILGVVVNVAQTEHDNLQSEIQFEEGYLRLENRDLLLKICEEMDKDESGELTKEEMLSGYEERADFRDALTGMDVQKDDLIIGFAAMDPDKSGTVTYNELVRKLYSMKETEMAFMLEQIKYHLMTVKDQLNSSIAETQAELLSFEKAEATSEEAMLTQVVTSISSLERAAEVDIADEKKWKKRQIESKQPESGSSVKDEAKEELLRAAGTLGASPSEDSPATPTRQVAIRDTQKSDEILEALTRMSKSLQEEIKGALQRIESGNDELALNTSKLLTQFMGSQPIAQRRYDDMSPVAVRENSRCCTEYRRV